MQQQQRPCRMNSFESGVAWTLLLLAAGLFLPGCQKHSVVPVCPKLPVPPPALVAPPESPVTAKKLEALLEATSKPVPVTPSG